MPTERTLLGYIMWIRRMMERGIVHSVQWCDTRGMTEYGHTKESIDRDMLLLVMSGMQSSRAGETRSSEPPAHLCDA
eukprot:17616-Pyramimonas_sp.AAC.1